MKGFTRKELVDEAELVAADPDAPIDNGRTLWRFAGWAAE